MQLIKVTIEENIPSSLSQKWCVLIWQTGLKSDFVMKNWKG